MTDRLLQFANDPWTAPLLRALGLPQPRRLKRCTRPYGAQAHAGRSALVLAAEGGLAPAACRLELQAGGADLAPSGAIHTLVADATGCTTAASLSFLHDALQSPLGRLAEGGRVVVLAQASPASPEAAACARAVEGFTRSLAKELGRRGATANVVRLTDAALPALGAALAFLGTDRSAYVSGQVLTLKPAATPAPVGSPRTAVVTGAGAGIGAATARRLAAEGLFVIGVDVPQAESGLNEALAGLEAQALLLDITQPGAGERLVQAVAPRGGVDVLVHNAGITRDRTFGRMARAEWDRVMAVNLDAIIGLDRALDEAGLLRAGAREVCLASISGIAGNAGQTNYAASKAAVMGYVAARAAQWRETGVTVNAVAPGFIETAMTQRIPWMVREVGRRLSSLSQGGQPEDVAEAIAFLTRPGAGGISGQTLRVCGQSFLGA